jgi:hypothetical protein
MIRTFPWLTDNEGAISVHEKEEMLRLMLLLEKELPPK